MDTHFARRARERPLDQRQHELVLGSLLGDGALLRTSAGWCFRAHHGLAQQWYVEYKYRFLEAYVQSPPRRSGKAYYFRTVTHPEFSSYREQFYRLNEKVVPIRLLREQLTAFGLAIWLMDDGSADGHGVRLNTQSFTHADNLALVTLLRELFGLEARLNRDKDRFRLRIATGSRGRLIDLVQEHICPQMAYKLAL
jgi:LAGLIDADG DNA endonuclease family